MILGLGSDLEDSGRLERLVKDHGDRFLKRIFSIRELEKAGGLVSRSEFLAKRFAAKEAFAKALGTGFSKGLRFVEIEVLNDPMGKPLLLLSGKALFLLETLMSKEARIHLSISDVGKYALAVVIIER